MRASEMISDLQKLIEQYGDLPVYWTDSEWGGPMYEVKDVTYETPQNWPSGQIPSPVFAVNYPVSYTHLRGSPIFYNFQMNGRRKFKDDCTRIKRVCR